MSHPNPLHDRANEYPSDDYKPVEAPLQRLKRLVGESKQIRKGNLKGKKKTVASKMRSWGVPKSIWSHDPDKVYEAKQQDAD